MGATKLQLLDLEEEEYRIFAVHTALPGFRLAFLFNQLCEIHFVLEPSDFMSENEINQPIYYYYDEEHFAHWKLIENKYESKSQTNFTELFFDIQTTQTKYILPEFQKANYIIKVEGDSRNLTPEIWFNRIKSSVHIQSIYEIPINTIKKNSKKNLIF